METILTEPKKTEVSERVRAPGGPTHTPGQNAHREAIMTRDTLCTPAHRPAFLVFQLFHILAPAPHTTRGQEIMGPYGALVCVTLGKSLLSVCLSFSFCTIKS